MSIQGTETNAKNGEKENMTIRSNQLFLHKSCVGLSKSMEMFVFL